MKEEIVRVVDYFRQNYKIEVQEFRGEVTLVISPEMILPAVQLLRERFSFEMLIDVTAVDYWPQQTPRFHLVYQLISMRPYALLRLRAPLDGNSPQVKSITGVYPNANWYEREVWDLFGIKFEGHPDPRRLLMPADWVGHPLRKDYPLGYEEVQFSFNYDEIQRKKPAGKL